MKSRRASVRIDCGPDRVDRAVQMLEDEWRRHGDVHLESFWAAQNRTTGAAGFADSVGVLVELVKADLRRRFDAGQRPTAAEYFERFPELACGDDPALSVVYEEFCLCEECDGGADVESFCDRYPDWKSSLASQLHCHRMISQAAGVRDALPKFPKAGEDFEEFQLLSRLGKGGTSRVFLARDISLGGKHVALKVTVDRGEEPKIQGALDHPHIVPVNSVTYQTETRLCGLSMPYQPGLPLDEIIKRVKPSRRPCRALTLWSILIDGSSEKLNAGSELIPTAGAQAFPAGDGWRGFPARGTYSEGAAWIVMILARALHYAHARRIYHRDVKPANVLLTVNHGPQLLDFNLAESPHSADNACAALRGGTLPYMAPEQIEAFLNPDRWATVGAGADIYSLGLVLRELLTGQLPDLPKKGIPAQRAMREFLERRRFFDVTVRRLNPTIPPSLEAIVAKCLALSPSDRYLDAESLAKDLERFLNHQPLLAAVNPSRLERVANYVKRQRRNVVRAGLIGVAALVLAVAFARPVVESMTPTLESSAAFQAAVAAIEEREGDPKDNAKLLSDLVEEFPTSCLARFYLAFAKKDDVAEAANCVGKALAFPDVERTVSAWSRQHPEFCSLLVDAAEARINQADNYAIRCDVDDPRDDEEERDNLLRTPGYGSAQRVLLLAQKLDPTSLRIERLLATTELIFGPYESAYRRLTHVIDSTPSVTDHDFAVQFFCKKLRGKVACLSVERDRSLGKPSSSDTIAFLAKAQADLEFCVQFLDKKAFTRDTPIKQYYVRHDQARILLALAEAELDLGNCDDAAKNLLESRRKIIRMNGERTGGLRVPKPATLTKRLNEGSDWLNFLDPEGVAIPESVASGRSLKPNKDQSSKNVASAG
jgi:serine/threonine protein kinase